MTWRRGWRSLGTIMLVILLLGLALGTLIARARMQRESVGKVRQAGGSVVFDYQVVDGTIDPEAADPSPPWLAGGVGDELARRVVRVDLSGKGAGDEVIADLAGVRSDLKELDVALATLGPEGFRTLGRFPRLEALRAVGTELGDDDLKAIGSLRRLKWLDLMGTQVSDEGMEHVARLPNLVRLDLSYTNVGDSGLARLAGLDRLERLNLHGTLVSDGGLETIRGMRTLITVDLGWTEATREGVNALIEARPDLLVAF